jgi:hypothetical protein
MEWVRQAAKLADNRHLAEVAMTHCHLNSVLSAQLAQTPSVRHLKNPTPNPDQDALLVTDMRLRMTQ